MTAPLRAQRDPSTPEALRRGLDALACIEPSFDVGAGATRFEARLSGAPTTVTAAPSSGTLNLWVVVGVVVLGAGVLGSWLAGSDDTHAPTPVGVVGAELGEPHTDADPPALISASDAAPPVAASQPAPAPSTAAPEPVVAVHEDPREARPARARKPSAAKDTTPEPDPLLAEMQKLNAARKHVSAGRYGEALSSIEDARILEHRRFDEEWQALEILALAGSGDTERARKLAERYLARHEGGRFNASIERALGERAFGEP